MTPIEVRAFQAGPLGGPRPLDYFGKPLRVDGDLGPRTRWAMDLATLPQWRQDVVRFLLELYGVREEGVNQGELVDRAMAVCRLDNDIDGPGPSEAGHPWCAALACLALSAHCPHAFVPDASVRRFAQSLHPVPADLVLPADVAYSLRADGTGHLGTVIARGDGWTASVDGNLGNQVDVVRYPTSQRLYASVEAPVICPAVPLDIRVHMGGTTR
jgi:hypothetical protein